MKRRDQYQGDPTGGYWIREFIASRDATRPKSRPSGWAILIAVVLLFAASLLAFAGPAMAFYGHNEGPGLAPKPTLEDRLQWLEKRARDADQRATDDRAKCGWAMRTRPCPEAAK